MTGLKTLKADSLIKIQNIAKNKMFQI